MEENKKRSWAEVKLENIRHNYRAIKAALPEGCKFLGVVKADAYGHGAVEVSKLLESEGADYLAVSCLDEAIELRSNGITMPILILGHTPPEYTETLIDNNITQAVSCLAKAEEYSDAATSVGKTLKIHIKLDTGMSRLGFICSGSHFESGVANVIAACKMPNLNPEGIFTHFAVSDETDEDSNAYTKKQFELFMSVIDSVSTIGGVTFEIRHCANTGAVVNHLPETALDMVRPGLLLYGYGDNEGKLGLKPCMRVVTTISTIKNYESGTPVSYGCRFTTTGKTRIGVLGIGYADGLFRVLSNNCSFECKGKKISQVGQICMDMCMVNINNMPDIGVGDEVEIFGENNDINKLAEAAHTIPYELLCSISKRVPRIYTE